MELNALSLLRSHIQTDNLKHIARELDALSRRLKPRKNYSYRVSDKGQGTFLVKHSREQRVVVKVSYSKNTAGRSWAAHGQYLQREHAQIEGQKGVGFNENGEDINIKDALESWQKAGDERFFKVILSPEGASQLDLKQHARDLIRQVERDLSCKLEWLAIDHNNTDHGHVHILIRGVNEKGKGLTLDPTYIAEGFRHRSQEIATLKLGLRTQQDMSLARSLQIEKSYVTELDRSIRLRSVDGVVTYDTAIPKSALARERRLQEIKRLKFLETLGLSEKIGGKSWRLSDNLEKILKAMQLSNDIIKSRAQHGVSIRDYETLLSPSDVTSDRLLIGKVVGMNLENSSFSSSNSQKCYEISSKVFTDWDRSLQIKANNHIGCF